MGGREIYLDEVVLEGFTEEVMSKLREKGWQGASPWRVG